MRATRGNYTAATGNHFCQVRPAAPIIPGHMTGQIDGNHSNAAGTSGVASVIAAWGNTTSGGVPPPDGGYGDRVAVGRTDAN